MKRGWDVSGWAVTTPPDPRSPPRLATSEPWAGPRRVRLMGIRFHLRNLAQSVWQESRESFPTAAWASTRSTAPYHNLRRRHQSIEPPPGVASRPKRGSAPLLGRAPGFLCAGTTQAGVNRDYARPGTPSATLPRPQA
jgi:hypothetical protein